MLFMVESRKEISRQQNHFGSGPQIGGDNYGSINYELLDPKTRVLVAKLADSAPELAKAVEKGIREGFVSKETVAALERAVQNINMDVAESLMFAGRNINYDVAEMLMSAGRNINEGVADRFTSVNRELNDRVRELNGAADSLRNLVGQVNGIDTDTVSRPAVVVAPPSSLSTDKWGFRVRLICWGFGIGVLGAAILTHYRVGIYATLVGVSILILLVLMQIANARRKV
jgi:hypothetical protein